MDGSDVTDDDDVGASYSYDAKKKELVSYDTPNIVKLKSKYIMNQGLAGAMFWVSLLLPQLVIGRPDQSRRKFPQIKRIRIPSSVLRMTPSGL